MNRNDNVKIMLAYAIAMGSVLDRRRKGQWTESTYNTNFYEPCISNKKRVKRQKKKRKK